MPRKCSRVVGNHPKKLKSITFAAFAYTLLISNLGNLWSLLIGHAWGSGVISPAAAMCLQTTKHLENKADNGKCGGSTTRIRIKKRKMNKTSSRNSEALPPQPARNHGRGFAPMKAGGIDLRPSKLLKNARF